MKKSGPTLWGRASSVNVQKVMWALSELGVEHTRIDAGWTYGQTDTDAFAAMNPTRRVPVWQEEGLTLWESHAIVRHLATRHRGAIAHDALADQWIEFIATTLQPPFIGVFYQRVRLAADKRSDAKLAAHAEALNAALAVLDGQLARTDWLNGTAFSTAEIAAGPPLHRVYDVDWPRADFPAVERWLDTLRARPAYRETVMTSYEELRA